MTKGKRGTRRKGRTGGTYSAKPGDLRDHSWGGPVKVTRVPSEAEPAECGQPAPAPVSAYGAGAPAGYTPDSASA